MITRSLLEDDALELTLETQLWPLVERWMPLGLAQPAKAPGATIELRAAGTPLRNPTAEPLLTLDRVRAWPDDRRGTKLRGGLPASGGVVSLDVGRARLYADPAQNGEAAADIYSMLTVSAALLLTSLGRALVHAAAVVDPDGAAWILAGDARSGKSTTCVTLASAGWEYLSDDQVVLAANGADGVRVSGWLRPFHLDTAAPGREPTGERREVLPAELGLTRWRRSAPLAGVILPVVLASQPTRLVPVPAADALAGLVRQSPWLLACPRAAPRVFALLARAAGGASYRLELGLDTFRRPSELVRCLDALRPRAGIVW
jgi:hypothetical protein